MRYTSILLAALLVAGAVIDPRIAVHDHSKSKTWARAYRQAATEKQKRAVCIAMIDDEVIRRGRSIAELDELFGTSFSRRPLPKKNDTDWGVVHFAKQEDSPNPALAAGYHGWYFAFRYGFDGIVDDYYLSNLHK